MSQENPPSKRERREAARAERIERERAVAAGDARRRRLLQLGGLLAAAAVVVIIAVAVSSGGSKKSGNAASGGSLQGVAETKALLGGIPQTGITLGDAKAPATIVEFADPQCPFCKDYTLNEMPALIKNYVRTGKAKMELRYLTFIGPDSLTAARVIEAAGLQDKLWDASDIFYRNQGQENSGYVTDAFLTQVLKAAGADPAKAVADAGSSAVSSELGAAKTLASRYGVDSTPTILVGPTGGTLKKDTENAPTAAGVGKLVDAVLAQSGT
ncbi:MAG TPA: thioredoxin domain-containing protein [Baekduia sp.]|uniref:DsbA family protein n=1 Tax=Baekduia sp. TaxID=2600305 RepID=UPI002B6E2B5D|nr:thioredoxin domain-containing protein [Baekduia sp.]HMJ35556.1 thioredoxin domain-containing protein [Baekduia sp.]